MDLQVRLDQREVLVMMGISAKLVIAVQEVKKEDQVQLVPLAPLVLLDQRVIKEGLERLENPAEKDIW